MGFTWSGALSAQTKLDEEAAAREELEESRKTSLLGLYLKKLEGQASFRTGDKYRTAAQASLQLEKQVSAAGIEDEDTLAFFNNAVADPFAAKEVLDFQEKLDAAGRNVPLSQIPSMMYIVKSEAPVEDKIDYITTITGEDMTEENYYKLAQDITKIPTTPSRTFVPSAKPGVLTDFTSEEKRQKAMSEIVLYHTIPLAKAKVNEFLDSNQDQKAGQIQNLLNQIQSGGDQADRAAQLLMDEFMTPAVFQENLVEMFPSKFENYQNNPYLPPQLRSLNTEPKPEPTSLPGATVLTEDMINRDETLQSLGAEVGDQVLGGKLYGPDGKPKQQ